MIIRDNNIEKWLFDYFEGNLTPHEEIELHNFISQNPSYQSEFEAWEKSYPSKEQKSKKNRVPVYAGASSLLVETSIWARFNWRQVAAILVLIGAGSLIGYYNLPEDNIETVEKMSANNENLGLNNSIENEAEKNIGQIEINETLTSEDKTSILSNIEVTNSSNTSNIANNEFNTDSRQRESNSAFLNDEKNDPSVEQEFEVINLESETSIPMEATIRDDKGNQYKSKLNKKAVIIFENELDKSINAGIASSNNKSKKRYYYAGFRELTGRGIGVRKNKKQKIDKELNNKREGSDLNILITENGGGAKDNLEDPDRKRKRSTRRNSEIALMNLNDPVFLTTNAHPLIVNSSLAGNLGVPRIKSSLRYQKNNSNDYLIRAANSYDMYIEGLKAGVGVVVSNNRLNDGAFNQNKLEVIYAQKFELSRESSFTASLKYVGAQNTSDISKMNFNSVIEVDKGLVYSTYSDAVQSLSSKKIRSDMGFAAWYDGQYLYGGIEIDNILHAKTNVYNESLINNRLPTSISAQIGTDYRKSLYSDFVISPQLNFYHAGTINEFWLGSSVKFRSLVAGVGIETLNSTTYKGMLGLQNHSFRIMYGIDYSGSLVENGMFASHEISMRFLLGVKRKNWSRFKN